MGKVYHALVDLVQSLSLVGKHRGMDVDLRQEEFEIGSVQIRMIGDIRFALQPKEAFEAGSKTPVSQLLEGALIKRNHRRIEYMRRFLEHTIQSAAILRVL